MRQVADEAGVTAGTIYHYYPSKTDLYIAAYTWAVEELYRRYKEAADPFDGAATKINAVLDCLLETHRSSPEIVNLLLRAWVEHAERGSAPLPIPPVVEDFLEHLVTVAVKSGELDPGDTVMLKYVVRSLTWGVMALGLTGDDPVVSAGSGLKLLVVGKLLRPPVSANGAEASESS